MHYRFTTPAIIGAWRHSRESAVRDALNAGQATRSPVNGREIELREWVTIEESDEPRNQ